MPKGYVLAQVEITDPAVYDQYRAAVPETLAKYGGRFVIRGGDPKPLEGALPAPRFVVLAFESPERALAWYNSPEYAPLKEMRLRAGKASLVLLSGVD